jgi:rubrerythrin
VILIQAGDVIELAMQIERSGETFYRAVAKKAGSEELRAFFEDLADQEVLHFQTFAELGKATKDAPWLSEAEWDEYVRYIEATVQSSFFEGPEKALALADSVTDETEAIRMAIRFERETLLFFYELHDIATGDAQGPIHDIIEAEKSHIRRLAAML